MDRIRLGKTELMVSKLGFGGIPIQRLDDDGAVSVVRRSLELGITFIDTANGYTTSEERIGKAISGRRDRLVLATKTPSITSEGVERDLNLSLKRLCVESIDLYQFHGVSTFKTLETVLDPRGPRTVLEKAKRAGTIKHIGITSHSMDVAKEAVKTDRFETIMFPLNFITTEAVSELLPLCREHDVGFIAMKPLAGGMLDNAVIAFKYLFQFPDIIPIPGIQGIHEIEEIVEALEGPWEMTETEEQEMRRLREELGTRFCRRCQYCQPCTEDIPISTIMTSRSFFNRMPPERFFSGIVSTAIEKAASCAECGNCEERCPYHLPIREMIAEHVEWYQEEKKNYLE
ncbi:aldo/keto reductase [Chloroflexota bacterium]